MRWLMIGVVILSAVVGDILAEDRTGDDIQLVEQLQSLQVFSGALDAVDFHPEGYLLASGGRDNHIRLWDTANGENVLSFEAHDDWVTSVVFSPDGRLLASGSRDNSIRLWQVEDGELVRLVGHHRGDITDLAFSPDGTLLASAGRDGVIILHHLPSEEEVTMLESYGGNVWDITFSHDGRMLASGSEDGSIWLWGLWEEDGAWLKKLEGRESPTISLAFSDDDTKLVAGGLDSEIHHYDLRSLQADPETPNLPTLILRGHLAPVLGLGWTSDTGVIVSSSLDGTIRLWDVGGRIEAGKMLNIIEGNGAPLTNLAVNGERSLAASVGTDGILNLWDVSAETIARLIERQRPVTIAAVSSGGGRDTRTLINPAPASAETPDTPPAPPPSGRSVRIPSAGIQSGVTTFYLDGISWAIDPWERAVGHLQGTAWVTGNGNMVLGGHSTYPNGNPGIFYNLYNVGIGDEIFVRDGDVERRYVVVNIMIVDYRDVSVVYPTSHNQLTLITCDIPSFSDATGTFLERLVVIANEV